MNNEMLQFAKIIVKSVRDAAIKSCDVQLYAKNMNSPIAKRWDDAKKTGDFNTFGEKIIADCVDDTIFHILTAIDNGLLNMLLVNSNGDVTDLTVEGMGELGGFYSGEWRFQYSNERTFDDFDSLK